MFLKKSKTKYTKEFCRKANEAKRLIDEIDTVVIGAGAGLSTSAGFVYDGENFRKYFSDFEDEYGFSDMYSGAFYPFKSDEEYWAYWSRFVYVNRYCDAPSTLYSDLLNLVKDKEYFVLTTNVDHCFQKAGFDKNRLFYTQGDYGLFQCSVPCCQKTYDNKAIILDMIEHQINFRIPSELVPYCPECGSKMTMNLRSDNHFVEDLGWNQSSERYLNFIEKHRDSKILFLELGVGFNTPSIIKYSFWNMTYNNKNAKFISVNFNNEAVPEEIEGQALCIKGDIKEVVDYIKFNV